MISIDEINRLKEENAKLKREYDILDGIIDLNNAKIQALKDENYGLNQELLGYKKGVQAAEIIELKAENEKLKEEVRTEKIYSSQIEELEESIVGQRNAYKKLNFQYIENCEYTGKLEQTLQEIRKIAEKLLMAEHHYKFANSFVIAILKVIKEKTDVEFEELPSYENVISDIKQWLQQESEG